MRKLPPLIFNKEQEQILLGSLLGDGCVFKNNSYIFIESHSFKQDDYLKWKNNFLNFIFRYNKDNQPLITKGNQSFKQYHELFYPNGKKIVTREILDKSEPLALAVWYMDDGSYNYLGNRIHISTQSFGLEGNQIIQQYFKERWDIDCKIQKVKESISNLNNRIIKSKINYYIRFDKEDTKKFIELIKPYVLQIPSMTYKIGLDEKKEKNAKNKNNEYYLNNKDRIKNQRIKWKIKNPDYSKNHYLKNKDNYKLNHKEWRKKNSNFYKNYYKKNRKSIKKTFEIYYKSHKNIILEKAKIYYQKNRNKILARQKKYYIKIRLNNKKDEDSTTKM